MRICPYCRNAVSDTARFCQNCGGNLQKITPTDFSDTRIYEPVKDTEEQLSEQVESWDDEGYDSEEEEKYSRENRRTVVVGVVLALLICIVGVGLWIVVSRMLNQEAEIDVGSGLSDKTVQVEAEQDEEEDSSVEIGGTEEYSDYVPETTSAVSAEVIVGTPDLQGVYAAAGVSGSQASSVLEDSGVYHYASLMLDGIESTSWQEAADGNGIGEWVQVQLDRTYDVKYITFKLGNWRNQQLYYANGRPAQILLTLDDQEFYLDFPDGMDTFTVEFSETCAASAVQIRILSVYDGSSWSDCCISEMTVYGS